MRFINLHIRVFLKLTSAAGVEPHVAVHEGAEAGDPAHGLVHGGSSDRVSPRLTLSAGLHQEVVGVGRLLTPAGPRTPETSTRTTSCGVK